MFLKFPAFFPRSPTFRDASLVKSRAIRKTSICVCAFAALMQVLRNMITLVDWIPTHIEYAVIGAVILVGVVADEIVKRVAAARKAAASRL